MSDFKIDYFIHHEKKTKYFLIGQKIKAKILNHTRFFKVYDA